MKIASILGAVFGTILGYSISVLVIMGISVLGFNSEFTLDNYLKILGVLLLALQIKQTVKEELK